MITQTGPSSLKRLSSSNSRWKQRQGRDAFARDARVQGLKSRAAFKLLEVHFLDFPGLARKLADEHRQMDSKHSIFRAGQMVVDLVSWSATYKVFSHD